MNKLFAWFVAGSFLTLAVTAGDAEACWRRQRPAPAPAPTYYFYPAPCPCDGIVIPNLVPHPQPPKLDPPEPPEPAKSPKAD